MALTLEEALADVREARHYLNRHVMGMTTEQLDAKPFPSVNSVREIFVHLLATARAVSAMLNGEPFSISRHGERHKEAAQQIVSLAPDAIIALHDAEAKALIALVQQKYARAASDSDSLDTLDTPVTLWTREAKLGVHLGHVSQELAYHTGQVSLLRQALVPDWDYFGDVFGVPSAVSETTE